MVSIGNVLGGLLFVVVGVAIAGFGVYTGYYQVQQVNDSVEETTATIQSSEVIEDRETEEGETEIEFYPRVSYTYTVDGEEYTGERIYSQLDRNQEAGELEGKEFDDRDRAEELAEQFEEGEEVTVYYYEGDPDRSFLLRPTVDWAATGGMGLFGAIFAFAGLSSMFSD